MGNKKIISSGKHFVNKDDIELINKILRSDYISSGPYNYKFEKKLNYYFGSKYSVALSSGTAALHLAGRALNWKKGDKVILTPITFAASANSILYANAQPIFCDIDYNTNNIDLNLLEEKLKKHKKIKSVIAVDYAGLPCDWKNLNYLSKKYNFKLINDNCHALGSKYKKNHQYAVKYSDIVIQSFHPTKNITTGEGGALITNNKEIYSKVKTLKNHGMLKTKKITNLGLWNYEINQLGFNYRLTDFQCALGISQLERINKIVKNKNEIANIYNDKFKNINGFILPKKNKNYYSSFHLYPLKIKFSNFKKNKKDFFIYMNKNNINLQVHYKPIYRFNLYKKFIKNIKEFPNAELFYSEEVSLPIYYKLSINDQIKVINKIKSYFNV